MPIRHCQLCGIKVIVDEDKASVFPFYCDLCSTKTSMKTSPPASPEPSMPDEMGMPVAPSFEELTAPPDPAPPPPPPPPVVIKAPKPPPAAAASSAVKCPVCSGEIPVTPASRPIKSRCPICNAELAIYPDGSVKSARDAELLKYAKTQEINVRPPTEDLKTKIREMIQEEQKTRMTPQPSPPTRPVAKPVIPQGPKIVIKAPAPAPSSTQSGAKIFIKPPTGKVPAASAAPPPPPPPVLTPKPTAVPNLVPPPPPPPPPPATEDPDVSVENQAPPVPMPEAPDEPELSEENKSTGTIGQAQDESEPSTHATLPMVNKGPGGDGDSPGLLPAARGTERKSSFELTGPKHRRVPFVVAILLILLPLLAGTGVHFFMSNDPSLQKALEDLGRRITASGQKLSSLIFPPTADKPADSGTSGPSPKQAQKTEQELKEIKDQIAVDYKEYLASVLKAYSEKTAYDMIDQARAKAEEKALQVRNEINHYKNISGGREPDLRAEFKQELRQFLIDLRQHIMTIEHNARKLTSDVAAPMIDRANRAKVDFNKLLAEFDSTYHESIMADEKTKLEPLAATAPPNPDSDLLQRLVKAYKDYAESEKDFKKKGAMASEFDRMMLDHRKQTYEDLKAQYEKKTGKPFEPPK